MAEWYRVSAKNVGSGHVIRFGGDVHKIISKTVIRDVVHFETDKGHIKIFKNAVVEVFR